MGQGLLSSRSGETSLRSLERTSYTQSRLGQSKRALAGQVLKLQERVNAVLKMNSVIRSYLPHLILGLSISLIMVGAYLAVGLASTSQPKATWQTNPLTISFLAGGHGTASDSFTCSLSSSAIVMVFLLDNSNVSGSITPTSFPSCRSYPPDTVTLTVTCAVPAIQCPGTYSGIVQIREGYQDIPANLVVKVVVT
jgi:hypothetical protein